MAPRYLKQRIQHHCYWMHNANVCKKLWAPCYTTHVPWTPPCPAHGAPLQQDRCMAQHQCHQLLDYIAIHPHVAIRYHVSKMILTVHFDTSYLSEPDSKSQVGGHYFLINQDNNAPNNGTILTLSAIIRHVVSSVSEAVLAALFYNCKNAGPLSETLEEMGHQQPQNCNY